MRCQLVAASRPVRCRRGQWLCACVAHGGCGGRQRVVLATQAGVVGTLVMQKVLLLVMRLLLLLYAPVCWGP
jgi:hypothetical protein